jgi:glycosyltransferase involved in cell wall biosynthesis
VTNNEGMMGKILFLSIYPDETNIQDGMLQRIKNIDKEFEGTSRCYLSVKINPFKKRFHTNIDDLEIIQYNIILDYFKIRLLLAKYNDIYIHSIYNFSRTKIFLKKWMNITLDLHGCVPEELSYYNRYLTSKYYQYMEEKTFKFVSKYIFVTDTMEKYYLKKYKEMEKKCKIVYPIISRNVIEAKIKKIDLGFNKKDVVFVYSGNFQKWQRILDVVNFIKRNDRPNYKYLFLTKNIEYIGQLLDKCKIDKSKCCTMCCSPDELASFYSQCNYGFIIRDNHILNRVANPTKLLEYLYFGITAIVDLYEIGDYRNYDHIYYKNEVGELLPLKSRNNKELAMKILENNKWEEGKYCKLVMEHN